MPANTGDTEGTGSIPGSRRSAGAENGNPPQYSCLENPMDRDVWWATDPCGVTESDRSEHPYTHGHPYLIKKDHILSFLKDTSEPIDKGLYVRTELPGMYGFLRALDIINIWGK